MVKKVLILVVCAIIMSGCGVLKQEKDFKKYALDYYENYMKTIDMDSYQVTIAMLKNSNKLKETNYNLENLKTCNDDSYINITIKNDKVNYEVKLNCK